MGFHKPRYTVATRQDDQTVYQLLIEKQYLYAYQLAKKREKDASVSLAFNLALCHKAIESYDEALKYLDRAFELNHTTASIQGLSLSLQELKLLRYENTSGAYLLPLNPDQELPHFAIELKIELARLDIYLVTGRLSLAEKVIDRYASYQLPTIIAAQKSISTGPQS